jgi:5-methylcytosine-specific restriction endonuclease McrA
MIATQILFGMGYEKVNDQSDKSFCLDHADVILGVPYIREKRQKKIDSQLDVASKEFLFSYEWRQLRMKALKKHGATCQCCGANPKNKPGTVINVDHIEPRKKRPDLALVLENLQVLCHECNHGKSNWDTTDWRE